MKPSEIFQGVLSRLHHETWTKGRLATSDNQRFCSLGHMYMVVGARVENGEISGARASEIRSARQIFSSVVGRSIEGFNDDPNTTFDDVRSAFEKALKISVEAGK